MYVLSCQNFHDLFDTFLKVTLHHCGVLFCFLIKLLMVEPEDLTLLIPKATIGHEPDIVSSTLMLLSYCHSISILIFHSLFLCWRFWFQNILRCLVLSVFLSGSVPFVTHFNRKGIKFSNTENALNIFRVEGVSVVQNFLEEGCDCQSWTVDFCYVCARNVCCITWFWPWYLKSRNQKLCIKSIGCLI
jgi:hypothetical protein